MGSDDVKKMIFVINAFTLTALNMGNRKEMENVCTGACIKLKILWIHSTC